MAKQRINSQQQLEQFSSSEVDTGTTWIDGRTIYRKTFTGTINVAAGNGLTAFAHGISGLSTDCFIVKGQGSIQLSGTTGFASRQILPFLNGADRFHISQLDPTNISYHATFAWGNSRYWFILEYVK